MAFVCWAWSGSWLLWDVCAQVQLAAGLSDKSAVVGPVQLAQVVDDSTTNKMLLVMDYLEGGPVMTREGLGELENSWRVAEGGCVFRVLLVMSCLEGGPVMTREGLGELANSCCSNRAVASLPRSAQSRYAVSWYVKRVVSRLPLHPRCLQSGATACRRT